MKLYLKNKSNTINAVCEMNNDQFKIIKGSIIDLSDSKTKITKSARVARADKEIVDSKGNIKKDVTFNSATTAAQFVVGQSINGKRVWKDKDGNKVLMEKK